MLVRGPGRQDHCLDPLHKERDPPPSTSAPLLAAFEFGTVRGVASNLDVSMREVPQKIQNILRRLSSGREATLMPLLVYLHKCGFENETLSKISGEESSDPAFFVKELKKLTEAVLLPKGYLLSQNPESEAICLLKTSVEGSLFLDRARELEFAIGTITPWIGNDGLLGVRIVDQILIQPEGAKRRYLESRFQPFESLSTAERCFLIEWSNLPRVLFEEIRHAFDDAIVQKLPDDRKRRVNQAYRLVSESSSIFGVLIAQKDSLDDRVLNSFHSIANEVAGKVGGLLLELEWLKAHGCSDKLSLAIATQFVRFAFDDCSQKLQSDPVTKLTNQAIGTILKNAKVAEAPSTEDFVNWLKQEMENHYIHCAGKEPALFRNFSDSLPTVMQFPTVPNQSGLKQIEVI